MVIWFFSTILIAILGIIYLNILKRDREENDNTFVDKQNTRLVILIALILIGSFGTCRSGLSMFGDPAKPQKTDTTANGNKPYSFK